jgi:type I restriction enzyme M protein
MHIKLVPIPEFELLEHARRAGSGDLLKDALAPFAFFVLLRWAEGQETEEQAIALFDEQPFEPLLPSHLRWSSLVQLDPSELFHVVHNDLLPKLDRLEGSPLAEILRAAAYAFDPKKLTEPLFYKAVQLVARQPFETPDDFQNIEKLIRKIIQEGIKSTRYAGEFITPPRVAHLMLDIAAPQPGETVYDPCFGMGYLLSGAARRIAKAARAEEPSKWEHVQNHAVYGIEKASVPYLVGLVRILLSGISRPRLALGDTLERNPYDPAERYDVIVAAPPIGSRVAERWRTEHFPIRTTSTENLFVQHIMNSLKPHGRAVIALPEGFLFRSGADEQLRKMLLTEFCVEGVISLPAGTLLPYTSVKPNILVFRRSTSRDAVWFQEAQPTGKAASKAVLFDPKKEVEKFVNRQEGDKARLVSVTEIIERDCDLSVKQLRGDELEAFIKNLREHDPQLKVVSLEEISEVISGIGYTRKETSAEPTVHSAPLIRVTELNRTGDLKVSALHLNDEVVLGRALGERRLQPGDVILSTQGTLGKVGVVREGHAGGVPAHGITTIRLLSESVQTLYFVRLLQSGPYQQWLAAHASGTTIMNIPVRELRRLPIPVPTLEIQRAITMGAKAGAATTELLKSVVSGRAYDDFLSFLLSDPAINEIMIMRLRNGDEGNQFARLAAALRPWRNKAAHDKSIGDPALSSWLLAASALAESLADAFELPTGAERLAACGVLEEQINELDDLKVEVDESLHERLWTLAESMKQALANARQRILEDTPIAAVLDSAFVNANMESEIIVRFKNDGSLPLRNLVIQTTPDHSETKTKLLRAGGELACSVPVPPRPTGSYPLNIKWRALRLDNKLIDGATMLEYSTGAHVAFPRDGIGTNPYIVGGPLKSSDAQEMFFGREDIIDQVRRSLRTSGSSTVLLLEGNRRAGKTSILYRMQTPGVLTGWIPVYWTTQRAKGHKSAAGLVDKEIFYNIAHELVLAVQATGYVVKVPGLGLVSPDVLRSELREELRTKMRAEFDLGSPLELLDLLLESISTAVTDQRVLLILDEFDKIQEGIESGVTSPQVPENLRALFHKHDHLSGILTGSRRIKHLRQNHWSALYGIGVPVTVDALDVESARRLVVEPVEGRLVYATNAREHVLNLTSCQPFLIQALCYRVFEEYANSGEQSVTTKTVEKAAQEMVIDNEHFRTLFDFMGTDRRRYLACVVNRLSEGPDRVSFDLIAEELEKDQIEYDTAALADDLQYLQELDVLDLEQHELGTSYRIKIPLFSRWLERNEHDRMRRQLAAKE